MGLSGTGQWVTHRCSDGVVDQADGLPDYSSGPGTGELHWTESFKSPAVFPFNCQASFQTNFLNVKHGCNKQKRSQNGGKKQEEKK